MKLKLVYLFLLFFIHFSINAQHILSTNLVLNPGFEQYTHCPDYGCQITYAFPWEDCIGGGGSSDYYNTCSTAATIIFGLFNQQPRTGNGEAGIYLYGLWIQDNYREYLMGKLSDSLKKNKRYCGEIYTSFLQCLGAVENIGMYFSEDTVYNYNGLFALQPQIENHKGIIMDTINWVKVNGSFIANGGEKHVTIGNFKDNLHTNYLFLNYSAVGAYYYFDDASVCECSFDINLGPDAKMCDGDKIKLSADLPNATYLWQDGSTKATFEVKQPGTYWVKAYVADYDITSTDTIIITAEDENICNQPLLIPNFITPNGDDNNDFFSIGNADKYELNLQVFNRWGNLIYQNSNYTNNFNCSECADGVYYYLLRSKSKRNGKEKEYKGSVTVMN